MSNKFEKSGIRMTYIIPEFKIGKNFNQDFIKFPDINIEINQFSEKNWETKKDLNLERKELDKQRYQNLLSGLVDNNKNTIFKASEIIPKNKMEDKENEIISLSHFSLDDKQNSNSNNSIELSQSGNISQYQDINEIRTSKINKKATIDKSKLTNVIMSSITDNNNKFDELDKQEDEDFIPEKEEDNPKNDDEKKNEVDKNVVIKNDAGFLKKETINREDFESIIEGYSEKDAVEKFLINIYNYETLEKEGKELPKLNKGTIFASYPPKFLKVMKGKGTGYFIEKLKNISKNLAS